MYKNDDASVRNQHIENSADRWRGNSRMWTAWNSQLLWIDFKVRWSWRVRRIVTVMRRYLFRRDDGVSESSLAHAFNLCFILAAFLFLLSILIFGLCGYPRMVSTRSR